MATSRDIKGTNWLVVIALCIVFIFSNLISLFVYSQIKNDLYKNKEAAVVSSGKVLNRYVIDTYELYFNSGTLKFQEVMNNINDLNNDFFSFQIITVDGNILFDSQFKDIKNNDKFNKSDLDSNVLGSTGVYVKNKGSRISYIVIPHVDDWGNHKYSVKYVVNYQDVNEKLNRYLITLFIITAGVNIIAVFVLALFSYNEKYRLEKARINDLSNINRLKDEFMTLVSHNLRTPLSVIKGYMSFISDPKTPRGELKDDINEMEEGVQRFSSLVEDIVFATSILSGEEKFANDEFNLEEIVREIRLKYDDQIKDKKLQFHFTLEGGSKFVGDKKAVSRIFDNLVENAIKFNLKNGSIDVKVENNSELKIIVSDTGVGIDSERLDSIVGFFHRGSDVLNYNFEGEGLGLYLTNLIVKHYNGQMHVTSEKDKGSTFEVTLKKENK